MRTFSRASASLILAGTIAWASGTHAAAQEMQKPNGFPDRPLTIIVPFGAGGGSDQFARAIADPMSRVVGQPIQIINKPGGGGRAGIPDFMTAPADGYTIMQFSDDVLTLFASGRISENPTSDWTPIGIGNVTFSQIYVRPGSENFTDWESLVAYAKDNPGKVTMANISHTGSMERVTTANLQEAVGVEFRQISYDKPAERYAALVGGHVDSMFEQPGDVTNLLKAGQIEPVLTILEQQPEAFAEVPSLAEAGIGIEPLLRVRGLVVRGDVDDDRVAYLEWAFDQAWNSDEFQDFLDRNYMTIVSSYRNRADSIKLIDTLVETYQASYEKLGLN